MTRPIERDNLIAAREKGVPQVDEAGATAPPTVHQENAGPTLSPGPSGHPSRANGDVEAAGLREPRGHPLADLAPWRGTEQSFRPERCKARGGPLYCAKCGTRQPKCSVHLLSIITSNESPAVLVHLCLSVTGGYDAVVTCRFRRLSFVHM